MIKLKPHLIQKTNSTSDGMGGKLPVGHTKHTIVHGVLDMLSGTDRHGSQNAITEDSTHVLVTLDYTEGITDKMRVVDEKGQVYDITYPDNPGGQDDHNELLLSLIPGETYEWSEDDGQG